MTIEEAEPDDFLQVLQKVPPPPTRGPAAERSTTKRTREERKRREKHAQMTAAQLAHAQRGARRTATLNTRVTPEFHAAVKAAAAERDLSIADILELSLALFLQEGGRQ